MISKYNFFVPLCTSGTALLFALKTDLDFISVSGCLSHSRTVFQLLVAISLKFLNDRNILFSLKIIFQLDDLELEEGEIPDTDDVTEQEVEDDKEREKLIREGQMTPFGTISTASKTVSFPRPPQRHMKGPIAVGKKYTSRDATKAELISRGEMTPFGTVLQPADADRFVYVGSVCLATNMCWSLRCFHH